MIALPYGRVPYPLDLGDRRVTYVHPPALPSPPALHALLDTALDQPIASPRIEHLVARCAAVTLIVSDATRIDPRAAFVTALRRRLPEARWTVAIANGTHRPAGLGRLGLPHDFIASAVVVDHDSLDERELVQLGTTSRGTPVRVHRCVVETDLVIAAGCIRPHYFAGFGAGVKAIFPGLGGARGIRINHALKAEPGARAGIVDENPCRLDLEEAVSLVPSPTFLLNGVCASDGLVHAAVAGDLVRAFRVGAARARAWSTVRAPVADIVIASDVPPITDSLYQSAKIAAATTALVRSGGMLILVAECAEGIGPLQIVNEAIFRIGILPRLAAGVRICLVSSLNQTDVQATLVEFASSVASVVNGVMGEVLIIPQASQFLFESVP